MHTQIHTQYTLAYTHRGIQTNNRHSHWHRRFLLAWLYYLICLFALLLLQYIRMVKLAFAMGFMAHWVTCAWRFLYEVGSKTYVCVCT